ncbi:uncharacterized protein Z519_06850 [Cladophialophora bantiana CBS 173.52]|uniref:IPT/TIG domain-containing protein n=1 Tax=Cladophialophora bantiana (strain ATCC 10958 / CBS 173.52 / CDC B-1940 / NIH 8579) TaxID=1442370 RepID=A0A0D2ET23_CLAB1|nr:uncharacterized protein Z519_06850 [Cladophialophora bantiana CBS 173.52]KIW93001.1 hypothetical protein Z519_06850 [Cladophialophora bantiana CBS 173.52]
MASAQDDDMYLFQTGLGQTPAFAGQDFDAFLETPAPDDDQSASHAGFLNPNDLTIKRETDSFSPVPPNDAFARASRGSASGSSSSSSESPTDHTRHMSAASTASPSAHDTIQSTWGSGINGFSISSGDHLFEDTAMAGLDQDFEASNQQMASDFDFDTAASTPSGFDPTNKNNNVKTTLMSQPFKRHAEFAGFGKQPSTAPLPNGQPQFFFAGSREASPLNAMLPSAQGQSPWSKHSPSSGLEETFNHITMNGDSPGNATFSPELQFSTAGFSFEADSSATPSTFTKDISSPPSTVNSAEGSPILTVHPTSLKSRVETQIPIKMTLSSLPSGVKKLRLPRHTVSKPKFLAKPEVPRSPEILELHTSLVCTSAMQDSVKLQRALARARGEEQAPHTRSSPASTESSASKDDEEKPLNGGEVRICAGCIQRERKRASRKKQKKPEEEELFQRDEERRVVVFNTNEVKEWAEVPRELDVNEAPNTTSASGAVQVELPMRIACYCRHQNEKMGFQVIFTIKDCRDKVIAQAMTNPIMITDDHKTHNPPAANPNQPPAVPTPGPKLPGAGVFSSTDQELQFQAQSVNPKMSRQAYSMTDLHALQQNFAPNFPMAPANTPYAIPSAASNQTVANFTPRNLSRPASPSGPAGPTTKRRKHSGSGKLPSGLTMTRLDTSQALPGSSTMPNTAASSPYAPNMASFIGPNDRPFAVPAAPRPAPYGNSPPTPNGVDPSFAANINRSISHENLPRQVMISAPPSRQPSRPGSPGSARNSFGAADAAFGQAVNNQLMGQPVRRPPPLIHKLVPAEGSVTGGTEVTLLGNGFYQGLEVMFGDTEATTTTFWGEKCLNCIAPPALQPGVVPVVFKHDHPQYSSMPQQSQTRPSLFTYVDDRELEIFRLALRTLGKQLQHPTDDPYSAAQQLLQGQSHSMWLGHGNYGISGGHQRVHGHVGGAPMDTLELEATMLRVLEQMDTQRLFRAPRFDLRRPSGLTLLHLAASLGLTRFVAGLLSRGADPNMVDNNGHTPMHHAAMNGHTHVIHRLRLTGANHKARSIRQFTPADLATSLLAYQATISPIEHYRSRSAGGTPMRLHSRSSSSLRSFWENASNHYATTDTDGSDDSDDFDDETPTQVSSEEPDLSQVLGQSNRMQPVSVPQSRRGSMPPTTSKGSSFPPENIPNATPALAPSAFMLAWRDHLIAQLQQFNENAQSVMPSLANLNGPLAAIQEYQAYPMMRRVSALFPQRSGPRQPQPGQREGWWETLTGRSSPPAPSSPPAYSDLYPEEREGTDRDWSVKKASTLQAVADAAADLQFEQQAESERAGTSSTSRNGAVVVRKPIEKVELSRDRKLFFFWIPLLAIALALMIRSSGLTDIFAFSNGRTQHLANEVVGVF